MAMPCRADVPRPEHDTSRARATVLQDAARRARLRRCDPPSPSPHRPRRPRGSAWTSGRTTSRINRRRGTIATCSPTRSRSPTRARTPQLRTRHWIITDGRGTVEEVRGDGVVGKQPRLQPGQSFEYTSGCVLTTPIGTMHGTYRMWRDDGSYFDAVIAPFSLALPASQRTRSFEAN